MYQQNTKNKTQRFVLVDATRGLAIQGVVVFHIIWDLEFAGFITGVAYHPIWLAFGKLLAGTFMFLVGVSIVLAHSAIFNKHKFLKRLLILVLAASMITVVSWFIFPGAFIYFGILHSIAVASTLGVLFLRVPAIFTLIVGALLLVAPIFVSSSNFDTRWLAWVGFFQTPPPSNDFVPVFPWVGLTLVGLVATKFVQLNPNFIHLNCQLENNLFIRGLNWCGRYSLSIYLVHQPILLAIVLLAAKLTA